MFEIILILDGKLLTNYKTDLVPLVGDIVSISPKSYEIEKRVLSIKNNTIVLKVKNNK